MLTSSLELEEKQLISSSSSCQGVGCAIFAIVPAGTMVISGSIVIIGNTLHWLERNGTCPDGLIRRNLTTFTEWASGQGGELVTP